MKMLTKVALAAALMTGVSGIAVVAPADAKKKEEAQTGQPQLKLSPDVLKPAQAAQTALAAKDLATAETSIAQIEAAQKTDDDKYIGAALRLQLEAMKIGNVPAGSKIDYTPIRAPLDALIANPKTPPAALPLYTFQRGSLAFDAKNYPEAISYFTKAQQLGYANDDPTKKADLQLKLVKAKFEGGDIAGGSADLKAAVAASTAAGQKAPEDYYRYGISKTLSAKLYPQTIDWMKQYVAAYPSPKTWRDVLYNFGLQRGSVVTLDKPQTVDLFRLMRASKSLADQYDYEEYAQKVVDLGLPEEAKTVIAEGRAAGKLPQTGNSAETLAIANKMIAQDTPIASLEKKAAASPSGLLSGQTGDAYLGRGEYAKAIPLYEQALKKGGVKNDEVNTHLGIAKAMAGDKAGAKTAFAAVTTAPRSQIAEFWSVWADQPAA